MNIPYQCCNWILLAKLESFRWKIALLFVSILIRRRRGRKAAVRKIPEQIILSEVKRMVEEMQALNKKLEDTVSSQYSGALFFCFVVIIHTVVNHLNSPF